MNQEALASLESIESNSSQCTPHITARTTDLFLLVASQEGTPSNETALQEFLCQCLAAEPRLHGLSQHLSHALALISFACFRRRLKRALERRHAAHRVQSCLSRAQTSTLLALRADELPGYFAEIERVQLAEFSERLQLDGTPDPHSFLLRAYEQWRTLKWQDWTRRYASLALSWVALLLAFALSFILWRRNSAVGWLDAGRGWWNFLRTLF